MKPSTYREAEVGNVEDIKLLLERGADVNAQGERYGNALQAASVGGHRAVVDWQWRGTQTSTRKADPLAMPCRRHQLGGHRAVELLLERGADVNAQGGYFGNALHAASWSGDRAVMELLLERGADVNVKGPPGGLEPPSPPTPFGI